MIDDTDQPDQPAPPDDPEQASIDYDTAKAFAAHPDPRRRLEVAARPDVRPEILYYLVNDPDPGVRRAVAANPATPPQASPLLARDTEEAVRIALGRRLGEVLEGLPEDVQGPIRNLTTQTLVQLAADMTVAVRAAMSTSLAEVTCAPPTICRRLAADVEQAVAEPMLRSCLLLSDAELIHAVEKAAGPWASRAVAHRHRLSARASRAVIDRGDDEATGILLDNTGPSWRSPR